MVFGSAAKWYLACCIFEYANHRLAALFGVLHFLNAKYHLAARFEYANHRLAALLAARSNAKRRQDFKSCRRFMLRRY